MRIYIYLVYFFRISLLYNQNIECAAEHKYQRQKNTVIHFTFSSSIRILLIRFRDIYVLCEMQFAIVAAQ